MIFVLRDDKGRFIAQTGGVTSALQAAAWWRLEVRNGFFEVYPRLPHQGDWEVCPCDFELSPPGSFMLLPAPVPEPAQENVGADAVIESDVKAPGGDYPTED